MSQEKQFLSFNQARKLVAHTLMSGSAPMLHGSPSSGKSAIGTLIAKANNLVPIVFSLMDHEPSDIAGLPDLDGDKATFKPFDTFPLDTDAVPEGKKGWLIMLDEFPSGVRAMQAASNKLLYERLVGNKRLHPKAYVMAMGNLAEDNAYVIESPTHTKSRQVHLFVRQDCQEWVEWALKADIDMRVIAFANSAPSMLSKFDPDSVDINYPCARTLETLSNNVKKLPEISRDYLPLLQGIIGVGPGLQFYNFCQLSDGIPTLEQILKDPEGVLMPTQSSYRHALSGILAENINEANGETLMKCILRLPTEYQHFVFSAACARKPVLLHKVESIGKWAEAIADKYLGKKY